MNRLHRWLAERVANWLAIRSDPPEPADVIFCFAGRLHRKLFALDLYSRGFAKRLLLSTGRYELRRYPDLPQVPALDLVAMAKSVPPPLRHYFVVIESGNADAERVATLRYGTLTEVVALRAWLARHPDVSSVLVVSSATHLRRIRACWRSIIPAKIHACFIAATGDDIGPIDQQLAECFKLAFYRLICPISAMFIKHTAA